MEEVKPKLKLPTLIFNEKTVELAPRAEPKPEPELQEAEPKADDHQEAKTASYSSRTQDLAVESRTTQEVKMEADRSERQQEVNMDSQKDLQPLLEVEAAAPSKWDLEESFIGENTEPEFALQLNLSKDEFSGMELESPQKELKEEEVILLSVKEKL